MIIGCHEHELVLVLMVVAGKSRVGKFGKLRPKSQEMCVSDVQFPISTENFPIEQLVFRKILM